MMERMVWLGGVSIGGVADSVWPFTIPAVARMGSLEFDVPVTFLAGENGSGTSTILEAIAVACGCPADGGPSNRTLTGPRVAPSWGRSSMTVPLRRLAGARAARCGADPAACAGDEGDSAIEAAGRVGGGCGHGLVSCLGYLNLVVGHGASLEERMRRPRGVRPRRRPTAVPMTCRTRSRLAAPYASSAGRLFRRPGGERHPLRSTAAVATTVQRGRHDRGPAVGPSRREVFQADRRRRTGVAGPDGTSPTARRAAVSVGGGPVLMVR